MKSTAVRLILATVLFLAFAASVDAQYYTVQLKNGTTFDIRYNPVKADWDARYTMFLTDHGNWIAVRNNEIADVVSHAEESGYGYQLNTMTLFLGWSPNDLVNDEVDDEGNITSTPKYEAGADEGGTDYSINQFLSISAGAPGSVGGSGIPLTNAIGDSVEN